MFEYESIFVEYRPEKGSYTCHDQFIGQPLGGAVLHDGPGWVFSTLGGFFMWPELKSITNLIEDLNDALEE